MCLAQGPQRSDAGEAQTRGPSVKHSTTEPLRSLDFTVNEDFINVLIYISLPYFHEKLSVLVTTDL